VIRSFRATPLLAFAAAAFLQIVPATAHAAGVSAEADAQALVDRAYEEHAAGRNVQAVGSYLKAYGLTRNSAILFNVATIYDRSLHERALAAEYYRRYAQAPDATPELVQKATERIGALKKEMDDEDAKRAAELAAPRPAASTPAAPSPTVTAPVAATAPAPAEAPVTAESSGSGLRAAGLVLGGVGLAAVGTGLVLGLVAKGKNDQVNGECGPSTCATQDGVNTAHSAVSLSTAATVTFIAGAAIMATGVTFFIVAPRSHTTAQVTVAPQVGSGSGGLTLYARF
jgi:hypothetical protein